MAGRGLPTFCKADFHPATTLVHAGLEVGVRRSTALQPCLAASSGCASGVGAFAGNRLQGAKRPKLGGRRSEARRGRSPKPLDVSTQRTAFHLSRTFADGRPSRSCDPFRTFPEERAMGKVRSQLGRSGLRPDYKGLHQSPRPLRGLRRFAACVYSFGLPRCRGCSRQRAVVYCIGSMSGICHVLSKYA